MIKTPFSGDVWQDYHPFTSWWADTFRNAMGQYGFININEMQSGDAELEHGIVTDQASYGKQIGRVVEALQAICENLDTEGWKPDQRKAVEELSQHGRGPRSIQARSPAPDQRGHHRPDRCHSRREVSDARDCLLIGCRDMLDVRVL